MNDPDLILDRDILAKIYNKLQVQSNRMDYLDSKIDTVIDGLTKHIKICEEESKVFITQLSMLTDHRDYLKSRLDSTLNWIDMHTKHHMDSNKEKVQDK